MRETWFVLEDGNVVHPNECTYDDRGTFRHKDGVAVAKRGDAYSSRGVDLDAMRAKTVDPANKLPAAKDREMRPATDDGKGYRTRGRSGSTTEGAKP